MVDHGAPRREMDDPATAPQAGQGFSPIALLRRSWWVMLGVTILVTTLTLAAVAQVPSRSTAISRVHVFGTEGTAPVGPGSTPADELAVLLAEFESPPVVEAAAMVAGIGSDELQVVASSPRQTPIVEVAVTTRAPEVAIRVANEIPRIVTEQRRETLAETVDRMAASLRAQAEAALEQAADLDDQITDLGRTGSSYEVFQLQQQRNALASHYTALRNRAAELELDATHRPAVGFQLSAPADSSSRAFPPSPPETTVLALAVGAVAGMGVVFARALLGRRLYREDLEGRRFLGLIEVRAAEPEVQFREATARLRPLFPARQPRSMLISMLAVDSGADAVWWATSGLAISLCESGFDVAALEVDFESDASPPQGGDSSRLRVQLLNTTTSQHPTPAGHWCGMLRARRHGGTALGAVYATETRERIDHLRSLHNVLFVDPTRSGVEGWLETVSRPDLVILVATEGRTTHEAYESARRGVAEAGLDAVAILLHGRRPRAPTVGGDRQAAVGSPLPHHVADEARDSTAERVQRFDRSAHPGPGLDPEVA